MASYKTLIVVTKKLFSVFFASLLLLLTVPSYATTTLPKIAIIIDDLGDNINTGLRVVHLPGPIVCSILPHTFYSKTLAEAAHHVGKEVMLHAPMQSLVPHSLGKGGLNESMSQAQFLEILNEDLHAVPYIQGVNNHMGSRLTMLSIPMAWLMQTLKAHHLYFIDSKTSAQSIAEKTAHAYSLPVLHRDVFLDDVHASESIQEEFEELLSIARQRGSAVAIGHPYPETLRFLEKALPHVAERGFQLVSASQLVGIKTSVLSEPQKLPNIMCDIYSLLCE